MLERNNFGPLRAEYQAARRGYPDEVFEYLKSISEKEKPKVLDIGCGTGISTRQLHEHSFDVVGADKDIDMLNGNTKQSPEISYVAAPADKLPFPTSHFDVVSAFTAFHWFNNEESLAEIKRVLRDNGIFFAALKTNRKDIDQESQRKLFSILRKYAGDNFDATVKHFEKKHLVKLGFVDITQKSFFVDEKYTVEEALTMLRSMSVWNLVAESRKPKMLSEMREFYQAHLVDGFYIRHRDISIISARKSTEVKG